MIIKTTVKSINDFDDAWFEEAYPGLPGWRKEKADKQKTVHGRKLSILAGKMVLDAFLENGEDPENVVFNKYGKPMVGGDKPFFFSLSHSKDVAALSVSDPDDRGNVGIDIEYIRPYDEKLSERFFTKEEQDYISFSADMDLSFTRIWTSKEAYGKFTGKGMKDGLKFSMFHDPLKPLDVYLPCCFEYAEEEFNGEKYLYTLCYGVIEV